MAVPSSRSKRNFELYDITLDNGAVITLQGHYIVRDDTGKPIAKVSSIYDPGAI